MIKGLGAMVKNCSKCGINKSLVEFYWRNDQQRHRADCKDCCRKYNKAYNDRRYAEDPNYWKRYDHRKRLANPELYRTLARRNSRLRRLINPQPPLEAERRYRARHPDRVKAAHKKWTSNNLEWYRNKEQRRKAQSAKVELTLTEEHWQEILIEYDFRCAYCDNNEQLTQDHVVPLSRGGGYTIENIVPACKPCNSSKKNQTPTEWAGRLQR